jgi:hypothetical protein
MEKEKFHKLLGDPKTLPDRLARGVGRDLMMAIAYALNHVELAVPHERDYREPTT